MINKRYWIKSISAVTNYNSSSCCICQNWIKLTIGSPFKCASWSTTPLHENPTNHSASELLDVLVNWICAWRENVFQIHIFSDPQPHSHFSGEILNERSSRNIPWGSCFGIANESQGPPGRDKRYVVFLEWLTNHQN